MISGLYVARQWPKPDGERRHEDQHRCDGGRHPKTLKEAGATQHASMSVAAEG